MAEKSEVFDDLVSCLDFNLNIDLYRKRVRSYIDLQMYDSALYWADKTFSLSYEEPQDAYWLAQCLFFTAQYSRAENVILSRGLEKKDLHCLNLVIHCHMKLEKFSEAMQLLTEAEENGFVFQNYVATKNDFVNSQRNVQGALLYVKGQVCEALNERDMATECYREALHTDIHCYDALDTLVQQHMMSALEENTLVETLPYCIQCSGAEEEKFLYSIYKNKLKKYHNVSGLELLPKIPAELSVNVDLIVCRAERLFYNSQYRECRKIIKNILEEDPYHISCLELEIVCLYELRRASDLLILSQRLVDKVSELPVSWYAAGCYYFLLGKIDTAIKYFKKAISLDKKYGPAWLACGHMFAVENEQHEAITTYFEASNILQGCHLMWISLGVLFGNTNSTDIAMRSLREALVTAPVDPYVRHEMGMIAFKDGNYEEAHCHFMCALDLLKITESLVLPVKWEPILNNLAHTCRKLQKYSEALNYHQQALMVSPGNPSTYSSMGLVHAITGNIHKAIKYFHKAINRNRDDVISLQLLNRVLEQMGNEKIKLPGIAELLPDIDLGKPQRKRTSYDKPLKLILGLDVLSPSYQSLDEENIATPVGRGSARTMSYISNTRRMREEQVIPTVSSVREFSSEQSLDFEVVPHLHESPPANNNTMPVPVGIEVPTSSGVVSRIIQNLYRRNRAISLSGNSESGLSYLSESTIQDVQNKSDSTLSLHENALTQEEEDSLNTSFLNDLTVSSECVQHNTNDSAMPTSNLLSITQENTINITLSNSSEVEFCTPSESARPRLHGDHKSTSLHVTPRNGEGIPSTSRICDTQFSSFSGNHNEDDHKFEEHNTPLPSLASEVKLPDVDLSPEFVCTDFRKLISSTPRSEPEPKKEAEENIQMVRQSSFDRSVTIPTLSISEPSILPNKIAGHLARLHSTPSSELSSFLLEQPSKLKCSMMDVTMTTDTNISTSVENTVHSYSNVSPTYTDSNQSNLNVSTTNSNDGFHRDITLSDSINIPPNATNEENCDAHLDLKSNDDEKDS